MAAGEGSEQLPANQVSAKHEKQVDTDPTEAIDSAGKLKSEKRSVINDHHDNGQCAEKIEPRLAFAICEARIDFELMMVSLGPVWLCSLSCGLMNARK